MANGFSVTIGATDRASGVLKGINRSLANLTAPAARLGQQVRQFGDVTGVTRLGRGIAALGARGVRAAESLARISPALGAITGSASIAGVAALVNRFAELGDKAGFAAARIGVGVGTLTGLQGAARLAGTSAEALTGGLGNLQTTLQDAVGGRNAEAVVLFNKLGISFRNADGSARKASDVMPELADAINKIPNAQLRALAGTIAFGGAYEGLLPLLSRGSAGMRDAQREAERYGTLTEGGAEKARAFAGSQARVALAVEGVANKVASKLTPVLGPLLDRLALWVANNGDRFAAFIERVAKDFEAWVNNGGVQAMLERLEAFGAKVGEVVELFGGWTTAAVLLGAAMFAGPVLALTSMAAKLASLVALKPAAWLLRLLGVGPAAVGATMLAAGATAGRMNAPVVDDHGNVIGNWGGAEGERNRQAQADSYAGSAPQSFMQTMRRLFGMGGASVASAGAYGMATPRERAGGGVAADTRGGMTPDGKPALRGAPLPPSLSARPGTAEQQARAKEAHEYFVSKGWTSEQASGLVANIHKESGFDNKAVGDGGRAYGIAQHHPDRRAAIERATGKTFVGSSYRDQLEFIHHELTEGTERAAGRALKAARTAAEAGAVVSRKYERPAAADKEAAERGMNAEQWNRRFAQPGALPASTRSFAAAPPVAAPQAMGPPATVAQPQGAPGASGRVQLDVNHSAPPLGTTVRVQTTGDVDQGRVRVVRSGLEYGGP